MKPRTIALFIIALTAAAIAAVMLPRVLGNAPAEVDVDRETYPVRGIDISAHNGKIDFEKVAADGIEFVFIKATEGGDWRDTAFERNYQAAMDAGLRVGAYHFFRFDVEGWRQSVNIIRALGDRHLDLPVGIDVEEWTNNTDVTTEEVVQNLRSLIELLRQNGREAVIYTNKRGYHRFIRGRFDDVSLWICSFTSPALRDDTRWTVWQHSHVGRVRGIDGPVDLNTYNVPARGSFKTYLDSVPSLPRLY